MSSFYIGLTGGIGSGKSTAVRLFEKLGIVCIDSDKIAREVVEPGKIGLMQLVRQFSDSILDENGSLDRSSLRQLVFSNPNQLAILNQTLHPLIQEEMLKQAANSPSLYTLLEIPLLIESGWKHLVHRTLVIDVSEETQKERAATRDGTTTEEIEKIISNQACKEERLKHADDIIHNSGTIIELERQVLSLDTLYRKMAGE